MRVHGYRLYTRVQLDPSVLDKLPGAFDEVGGELVESANQVCFPVADILRFGRVLSTSRHGALKAEGSLPGGGGCCHQGNVFVNDGRKGKWDLKTEAPSRASAVGSDGGGRSRTRA